MQPEVLVELVAYLLLAGVVTAVGIAAEINSYVYLTSGETTVALWLAGMGLLCLYAGVYMLGYGKLLPAIRDAV
ncbi:hypothetical protein [Natranaeroarchaeum aerophilus]|uniref:DUF8151 domain-containing protein n=1 Tax=Natranaeroarchaeum aerophilus TaxID=2917711 RepID=A0AAE3FM46_9EURY|nr:hypothetical protein [Natranaeroarchaeum aerophilus]MCL9812302.1 hypothetical protein [Natranaeroarchaeum aerophilus]